MGSGHRSGDSAGHRTGAAALKATPNCRERARDRARVRLGRLLPSAGIPGVRQPCPRPLRAVTLTLTLTLALPFALRAQEKVIPACTALPAATDQWYCTALAQSALIAQARLGVVAAGGNPVAGSASTLGMRLGSTPRVSVQLRVGGAPFTIPSRSAHLTSSFLGAGANLPTETATPFARVVSVDGALGLYQGASPAPTVGGVGSLDLFGSLGVMPGAGGGLSGTAWTGGLGARLGILRESFTTPGITFSGAFRRMGGFDFGDVARPVDPATGTEPYLGFYSLGPTSSWSGRAVVGKRFLAIGTSAGLGIDRFSSHLAEQRACPTGGPCQVKTGFDITAPLVQSRANAFLDLTWTSLVFTGTAELGWQKGGSPATAPWTTGFEDRVRKGGPFGSLALRLTI